MTFNCRDCGQETRCTDWWWVDSIEDVVGLLNECGCQYTATLLEKSDLAKLKAATGRWESDRKMRDKFRKSIGEKRQNPDPWIPECDCWELKLESLY